MASFSVNNLSSLLNAQGGIARANRYMVELDRNLGGDVPALPEDFSILCQRATMPGKQILSHDRVIGPTTQKIAYTYGSEDVTLGFLLTNDFLMKKYFEGWQQMVMVSDDDEELHYPRYKDEYAKPVHIHQLDKAGNKVYSVTLFDAYPTTVNAIDYSNDGEGVLDLTVQLSYKRWAPYRKTLGPGAGPTARAAPDTLPPTRLA